MTPEAGSYTDKHEALELTQLFLQFQAGDPAAFNSLYSRIRKPLMAYSMAMSECEDDAKDLFHATMLKVYESRMSFKSDNVSAWIFAIARNAARSIYRKTKRITRIEEGFEEVDTTRQGLDDDERSAVANAIARLREEYRAVIYLRYYGELSVAEIAAAESISVDLVKVRLFRARAELASMLGVVFKETI